MKTSRVLLGTLVLVVVVILLAHADDFLCDGQVSPVAGDNWTWFRYTVWWTGESNPPNAFVHIDGGTALMMTLYDLTPGAFKYEYYTRLSSGDHNFYFDDQIGGRDPNTGVYAGPDVE